MNHSLRALLILMTLSVTQAFGDASIYFNGFDNNKVVAPGVIDNLTGPGIPMGVQGWAGIGTGSNVFENNFLRNDTAATPPAPTTLTLSNLPAHSTVSVHFLLAIIDSWDGVPTNTAGPDFFNVTVNGAPIFLESFTTDGRPQSFVPPTGVLLSSGQQLGYHGGDFLDAAYDMGKSFAFNNIADAAGTLTISWFANGSGWQGGDDESWALENVEIFVNAVPEPASATLAVLGVLGLATMAILKSKRRT